MSKLKQTHQRGSALIGALFLIVVVAALGAFAINLQSNQRQEELLELTQHRVELAAQSAMESRRFQLANGAACSTSPVNLGNQLGLSGISVFIRECRQLANVANMSVFEVVIEATYSNYGDPEFVRRTLRRTIRR
jgi:MSHA biogenesis protein MshP